MQFRRATIHDLPALAQMRWDFRAEDGEPPIQSFPAFEARYSAFVGHGLQTGAWTYWVAEQDGMLCAHVGIDIIRSIPRPGRMTDQWGYLTDCYTRPVHRGRGVGSLLLETAVQRARTQDLELLLVSPSEESGSFYARSGFAAAEDFLTLPLRTFEVVP